MPVFLRISLKFLEDLINFPLFSWRHDFFPLSLPSFEEESNVSLYPEWFLPAFLCIFVLFSNLTPCWELGIVSLPGRLLIYLWRVLKLLLKSKLSTDKTVHFCLNELKLEWSTIFWQLCQDSLIKCGPKTDFIFCFSFLTLE